jgi:sortase A
METARSVNLGKAPGRKRRYRARRLIGLALILAGLSLLVGFGADWYRATSEQNQLDQRWSQLHDGVRPLRPGQVPPPAERVKDGIAFAIRVPKFTYRAAIAEGVSTAVLAAGPGHYPNTPWPGEHGNVGVAAHNVYWIKFGDLQPGDEVVLETRWGDYRYQVTGRRIVDPNDTQALSQSGPDRATLTTCWPLWAGSFAQQRLVISAAQTSGPKA